MRYPDKLLYGSTIGPFCRHVVAQQLKRFEMSLCDFLVLLQGMCFSDLICILQEARAFRCPCRCPNKSTLRASSKIRGVLKPLWIVNWLLNPDSGSLHSKANVGGSQVPKAEKKRHPSGLRQCAQFILEATDGAKCIDWVSSGDDFQSPLKI